MTTSITPLRLTFGGGGSDLTHQRGICLSATINKYVTVTVTPTWSDSYTLHYSQFEKVTDPTQIAHRIIRKIICGQKVAPGIQVSSIGEIPAGTGLGSSGAFTIGLLRALHPYAHRAQLVEWACDYDLGQQDQWSAAYGGWNVFDFAEGVVRPINTTLTADDFTLCYTGLHHDAAQLLTGPAKPMDVAQAEVLHAVTAIEDGDLAELGYQFTSQWKHKYAACPSAEHHLIDGWIEAGINNGAYGGKLIGAGNGGFILFAGDPGLVDGLLRTPFEFTDEGTRCV